MGRFAGLAMCPAEAKLLFCNSFPQFVGQFSGSVVQLLLWVSFDPNTDGEEKIGIISFQEFFSLPSQWLSARCQGGEVFGKQMWLIPVSWAAPPSALHKTLYNDFTQCSVRGEGVRCSAHCDPLCASECTLLSRLIRLSVAQTFPRFPIRISTLSSLSFLLSLSLSLYFQRYHSIVNHPFH